MAALSGSAVGGSVGLLIGTLFFGENGAQLAAESHCAAIDYIEKIITQESIDCDFERIDGYLFVPPEDPKDILDKEFVAIQRIGKEINKAKRAPFSSFDTGPCLHFPKQAQFHILKYLRGLIKAILKFGINPGNKNIYIATGDSGNGMTSGTIAGILIPDLILGKANPWESLYEPSRKTLFVASEYIHETLNVFKQ